MNGSLCGVGDDGGYSSASVDNDCNNKVNIKNNNFDRSVSCIVTGSNNENVEKEQEDNVDDL